MKMNIIYFANFVVKDWMRMIIVHNCDEYYDDNQEYGYLDDIRPGVDYVDCDWIEEDDIYKEDYL